MKIEINKKQILNNNTGFTLVELLTVAAIIVLITTLVLYNFRAGERNTIFLLAAEQIGSDLRKMQTQSLTGIIEDEILASGGFGAYFDLDSPDEYILFRDDGDELYGGETDNIIQIVSLPANTHLSALTSEPLTIVFKPPKPTIYLNGSLDLNEAEVSLINDTIEDKTARIKINRITGRIAVEIIDF